jgi:hypothetical protein
MRQACKERLVREGKAHAALVFDGDLAVAMVPVESRPRPSSPAARRDQSDHAASRAARCGGPVP